MREGDILLTSLPQSHGTMKNRPVLCLAFMPPFQDLLVCGISTQLHQEVPNFDEVLSPQESDYLTSHLKAPSLIRLGYLAVLPQAQFMGKIGSVSQVRVERLRKRLADFLRK
jgi:mRNA interferase MazF